MNKIINVIKGIVIGIATLVPGVSGGTMAIILGIYDDMIHAVSSFFKDIKKNIIFLMTLGIGGIIGLGAFSKLIEYSLLHFHYPVIYLFLGIIIGGIPVLMKKVEDNQSFKIKKDTLYLVWGLTIVLMMSLFDLCFGLSKMTGFLGFIFLCIIGLVGGLFLINNKNGSQTKKDWLYYIIGFLIIVIMSIYDGRIVNLAASTGVFNFVFLCIAGIIIAVALILPGISTSFMLLALGLYEITLKAINNVELNYLIPIVLGVGIGVITTTQVLENFMKNKPRPTYMLILGFVIGSIIEVFPGTPSGVDTFVSLITFILGFIIIRYISNKYGE